MFDFHFFATPCNSLHPSDTNARLIHCQHSSGHDAHRRRALRTHIARFRPGRFIATLGDADLSSTRQPDPHAAPFRDVSDSTAIDCLSAHRRGSVLPGRAPRPPAMFTPWLVVFGWLKQHVPTKWSGFKQHFNFITLHCMFWSQRHRRGNAKQLADTYIISMSLIGSIILYPTHNMPYVDALFFGSGAATQSGLNT